MDFEVDWDADVRCHVTTPDNTYRLELTPFMQEHLQVAFRTRCYTFDMVDEHMVCPTPYPITARDLHQYPLELRDLPMGKSIVEVGGGLGAFVPTRALLAREAGGPRPTIIDPADYGTMAALLLHAKETNLVPDMEPRIDELMHRIDIITNPWLVNLVPEFLEDCSYLNGQFDVVVEIAGPLSKAQDHQEYEEVWNLEKALLVDSGLMVVKRN